MLLGGECRAPGAGSFSASVDEMGAEESGDDNDDEEEEERVGHTQGVFQGITPSHRRGQPFE